MTRASRTDLAMLLDQAEDNSICQLAGEYFVKRKYVGGSTPRLSRQKGESRKTQDPLQGLPHRPLQECGHWQASAPGGSLWMDLGDYKHHA